ncbi:MULTISPECIES: genetic competence negative regulator [Paenibacillus]|uniref:Adapter protein MecA 2 n=1 Tax=Paenibacillus glycanilyticus TaxID=126569 RepID=A0ABQ6NMC2_9BACL|nr:MULTISPECIES: genetic competence negative regulator [Paenibacillus]ACT01032.1 Negative regulator of genetic competence [Paenibacillus sp. JDR-2]MCK9857380.1 genetic competence negative regulator [Paenibacillus sp. ATY16]GMK46251.1 adapter protein MecA 2 [Paenibacillus glycanilyticus]
MKIERLSQDKIRIFLTFDDLLERGIQKEDMWREIPKVHDLFSEMMEQAYSELGFDASGPLAVEVFALPAQGMVVIVTRGKMNGHSDERATDDEDTEDEIYEMEVTMEQSDIVMYSFRDFEDVINVCKQLQAASLTEDGRLYSYNGKWILALEPALIETARHNAVIALLAEYGEATSVTYAMLEEYGKVIMPSQAVREICTHFYN